MITYGENMLINNKDENKMSEKLQREVIDRVNQAYDAGSADCLKILIEIIQGIKLQAEQAGNHINQLSVPQACDLFLSIIEEYRQTLYKAVEESQQENLIEMD